ncbi:MAG: class I SAM-dependent methyltransferase [Anaerolineaceae bacterium]|nr:class I SAM-dependent methyltransferase [Anaerolineaceae bacterium]
MCWPAIESSKQEKELTSLLLKHFDNSSFSQLIELRFQQTSAPTEFLDLYRNYQSTMHARGYLMIQMFRKRLEKTFKTPDSFLALDLGCGVGSSSAVLAKQFQWVIAVDPSLPDLILAKKYFEENKITNVILVRSFAQNLPIKSGSISLATSINVIEHLFDVQGAFAELHRVLKRKGCFCGDSRNRFDLFFPEPHAQLRWVGFWPRRLQPWYVNKLRNVSYSSAYLLSCFELRKYARATFGKSYTIVMPLVSAYGHSTQLDEIIRALEKLPLLRNLAIFFFPSHLLIAQK